MRCLRVPLVPLRGVTQVRVRGRLAAMGIFDSACASESSRDFLLSMHVSTHLIAAIARIGAPTHSESREAGAAIERAAASLLACLLKLLLAAEGEEALSKSDAQTVLTAAAACPSPRVRKLAVAICQAQCATAECVHDLHGAGAPAFLRTCGDDSKLSDHVSAMCLSAMYCVNTAVTSCLGMAPQTRRRALKLLFLLVCQQSDTVSARWQSCDRTGNTVWVRVRCCRQPCRSL